MVAQPLDEFLTPEFLEQAAAALRKDGFISDEHAFAPYRETVSTHVEAIQRALADHGERFDLLPSFVKHPQAGYAYFIYDENRFPNGEQAAYAVGRWLDRKYRES